MPHKISTHDLAIALHIWRGIQVAPDVMGICDQTAAHPLADELISYSRLRRWQCDATERWPQYSGCRTFPVPDPEHPKDADAAYAIYMSDTDCWTGTYGRARHSLLQFLIDAAEQELRGR